MQAIQQFLLLLLANIKRIYTYVLGVGIYLLGTLLLYAAGFPALALAAGLFLWCVIARPSVELKNLNYILWSLRCAPIIVLHVLLLKYVCVYWVVTGMVVPILIFSNLYLLDSGLRLKRLLYALLGIVKMYGYTWYMCIPTGLLLAGAYISVPWVVIVFGVIPAVVTFNMLIYYKELYQQFRVFYAAD